MFTPSLGCLRLATPFDIARIGLVAAAAFYYSDVFQYERPDHKKYPKDTVASYRKSFSEAIFDDASVVIVAEEEQKADEAEHANEELRKIWPKAVEGERVIVGVLVISFASGSRRVGQFKQGAVTQPQCQWPALLTPLGDALSRPRYDPEDLGRDQSQEGCELYKKDSADAKAR